MSIETNYYGVNKLIKATILSDEKMRKIGFIDHSKKNWYFCRFINFPKEKEWKGIEISFNVTIPKDGSDIKIDILDEDFCQPFDYQYLLSRYSKNECANMVKEQVEKWMMYLQDNGVLYGHRYGEYI